MQKTFSYLKKIFILGMIIVWGQLSNQIFAQNNPQENFPTFLYKDGHIRGTLPYGEPFMLTGSTIQPNATSQVDVVQLTVLEEENPRRRKRKRRRKNQKPIVFDSTNIYYSTSWWSVAGQPNQSFELYISRPLQLSTAYNFRFNFFHKYKVEDEVTRKLVADVKESIFDDLKKFNKKSVRVEDINNALNAKVQEFADSIKFGYLNNQANGEVEFEKKAKVLKIPVTGQFSANVEYDIANIIRDEMSLLDEAPFLNTVIDELDKLKSTPAYKGLITRLENLLLTSPNLPKMYSATDIVALRLFVENNITDENPFDSINPFLEESTSNGKLTPKQDQLLLNLFSKFETLKNYQDSRNQKVSNIKVRNQRIGSGGLDKLIAEGFILANSAEVISTPFTSRSGQNNNSGGANNLAPGAAVPGESHQRTTGFNAINIGTAYGVAVVGLNLGNPSQGQTGFSLDNTVPDMISYVGAKFYLSQVDKRVPNPYPLLRDKLAIIAGVKVSGELNFKGQSMANVIGVQPVLGMSFDLTKTVSLEIGGIFFEEPSLSPLNSINRLRVAPFAGMSIDANAFNSIKNLLKNIK